MSYYTNEILNGLWHRRHEQLMAEAENRLLARRLLAEREPKFRSRQAAAALGFLAALIVAGILLVSLGSPAHASTTFTVNTTSNEADADVSNDTPNVCDVNPGTLGSQCTLRAAIEEANNTPGADSIHFSIPGTGVKTIKPIDSPLPPITEAVTIDGYTQPGSLPNTLARGTNARLMIELKGSDTGLYGLGIVADNTVIRGLVINGFQGNGIGVSGPDLDSGVEGVRLEGNFIGTDALGTIDRGNGNNGVSIYGSEVTVGGASSEERNLISGNTGHGVSVVDSSGVKVLGNLIGTKKDAKGALGNDGTGVAVFGGTSTTVGGTTSAAANTIAFNAVKGVQISESYAVGNGVLSNSIFSNGGLGIDLGGDGMTPNDGAGDADLGPNGLQNSPLITSAKTSRKGTTIKGNLSSQPNTGFTIQLFSNPSGGDEGTKFIGQKSVTTDASGVASFTFKKKVRAGTITATATNLSGGDTSEFSAPKKVVRRA